MKLTKTIAAACALTLTFIAPTILAKPAVKPAKDTLIMMSADTLPWQEFKVMPGVKVALLYGDPTKKGPFTVRLKFPAKYQLQPHSHAILEQNTVVSGTLNVGIGDTFDEKKAIKLSPGSFLAVPAHLVHYTWTDQETVIQITGYGPWGIKYVKQPEEQTKN